jgi:D-glycero-D-manno-heptose 1,7-bisphosphate phosphatase
MEDSKCVFLDRDGVINVERGDYTFRKEDFVLHEGVPEAIKELSEAGYLVVVVTNQAGISKGRYTREDMESCHKYLLEQVPEITKIYVSPYHPDQTASLSRKPGSLLFEKAIARFAIDPKESWMIGDRERDLIPARQLGIKTVLIGDEPTSFALFHAEGLYDAVKETILRI